MFQRSYLKTSHKHAAFGPGHYTGTRLALPIHFLRYKKSVVLRKCQDCTNSKRVRGEKTHIFPRDCRYDSHASSYRGRLRKVISPMIPPTANIVNQCHRVIRFSSDTLKGVSCVCVCVCVCVCACMCVCVRERERERGREREMV